MLSTDPVRPGMDPVQGAVLRVQLDGLIASLPDIPPVTEHGGDLAALRLLNHLVKARQAAAEIETRDHMPAPYRGVRI